MGAVEAGFTAAAVVVSMEEAEASTVARLRPLRQVTVRPGHLLLPLSVRVAAPLRARAMAAFPGPETRTPAAARDLATRIQEPARAGTASGILLRLRPLGVNLRREQRPARSPQVAAGMR